MRAALGWDRELTWTSPAVRNDLTGNLTTGRNLTLLPHSRPQVQLSTNEDPMTKFTLRPDAIDRLAQKANGSFRLSATERGHRLEIDRRDQQG
jgi:hypothetical protein